MRNLNLRPLRPLRGHTTGKKHTDKHKKKI